MKLFLTILLCSTLTVGITQIDWVGVYECKKGDITWQLEIKPESAYNLKLSYPIGTEGGPGTWKQDKNKLMLYIDGDDKPHTIYKVKFKGDVQWLKAKKLFGSKIFLQRRFKLQKL